MIARSRKRPRVTTCRFNTFWYLCQMEALYMIIGAGLPRFDETLLREWIYRQYCYRPKRCGEQLLARFPDRRIL